MNDLSLLVSIGTNLFSTALVLAVAVLMVRHQLRYRWLTLTGAIAFAAASMFSTFLLTGTLLHLYRQIARWSDWLEYSGLIYSWGLILFLLSVFLHLLRRTRESKRLAELEAILNQRQ